MRMTLKVNKSDLLKSDFSDADLQKIKNNVENYVGSIEDAIQDLANRFVIAIFVVLLFPFYLFYLAQLKAFSPAQQDYCMT